MMPDQISVSASVFFGCKKLRREAFIELLLQPRSLTQQFHQLVARQCYLARAVCRCFRLCVRDGTLARWTSQPRLVQVAAGLTARVLSQVPGGLAHVD